MNFAKIIEVLSEKKCSDNEKISKYRLLDVTDSKVYALDIEDYKPYSFNYAKTKDDETQEEYVVIDFESVEEMSLSARNKVQKEEFEEFEIQEAIGNAIKIFEKQNEATNNKKIEEVSKELSEQFTKEYDELKQNYEAAVNAMNILQTKVDTYEKAEKEAKIEQHKKDIDTLVDGYADKLSKCSAYLVYKANIEKQYERSCEQVEQDLMLMLGKFVTSKEYTPQKKFSYEPKDVGVMNRTNEAIINRYGHLLDKYIK